MPNDCITYQNSGYFIPLIVDYLDQKSNVKPLYNRFPSIENFKFQLKKKKNNFPVENRKILVEALKSNIITFKFQRKLQITLNF